ncbi:MAG: hypothetical protein AAF492_15465 [Verrucomicrobiota bacterium]
MIRGLKISIFFLFILSVVSLCLGTALYQKREMLKARVLTLEDSMAQMAEKLGHEKLDVATLKDHTRMSTPLNQLVAHGENMRVDLEDTRADLADVKQEHAETMDTLASTRQQLATAQEDANELQDDLERKDEALAASADQLAALTRKNEGLAGELETAKSREHERVQKIDILELEVARLEEIVLDYEDAMPTTPDQLASSIVMVDPEWNWVILDKGRRQGLAVNSKMHVHRNQKLIGMLKVTSLKEEAAVADIVTTYDGVNLARGDGAIYLR